MSIDCFTCFIKKIILAKQIKRGLNMSEITTCTLSEYIVKVGSHSEVARMLGLSKQHIHITVNRGTPVFIEHDNELKIVDCYLKRDWGKA